MRRLALRGTVFFGAFALTLSGGSITLGTDHVGNYFPFGFPVVGPGTRYQEAYSSSLFSGPVVIAGIEFFLQPGGIDDALRPATYFLSLSTIQRGVDDLSDTNFDGNLGTDNTPFLTVSLIGGSPNELSFVGTPFLYDPSAGNLLLDIQLSNMADNSGSAAFQDEGGDGPATIARYTNFGTGTSGFGLVTKFDVTSPVPEPGTGPALLAGLAAIALLHIARRVCAVVRRIGSHTT